MNKIKTIAAAVALVAATGANAALDIGANSSLAFTAFSNGTADSTILIDLGFSFDQVVSAPNALNSAGWTQGGTKIVWDFNANTITRSYWANPGTAGATYVADEAYDAGTNGWSATFADWNSTFGGNGDIKFAVMAAAKKSISDIRVVSTSKDPLSKVDDTLKGNSNAISATLDSFYAPHRNAATHTTVANGASNSDDIAGTAAHAKNGLGTSVNFNSKSAFVQAVDADKAANFFYFDNTSPTTYVRASQFATDTAPFAPAFYATFSFDQAAGTLTYTVPVPEADTYAMLLAGLGMIGLMARRRRLV